MQLGRAGGEMEWWSAGVQAFACTIPFVIPGRAEHEPGIHLAAKLAGRWIPGSRQASGAPRNDSRHSFAISRRIAPEVCKLFSRPLEIRGRRECRMRAAPAIPCAMVEAVGQKIASRRAQASGERLSKVRAIERNVPSSPAPAAKHNADGRPSGRIFPGTETAQR